MWIQKALHRKIFLSLGECVKSFFTLDISFSLKSDLINASQSFQVKSFMAEYFGIQNKTLILLTNSSWRKSICVLARMAMCLSLIPRGQSTMKGHSMDAFSQTNT